MVGIDAIEVNNANRPLVANDLAEEVAIGLGLPGTGGSDTRDNINRMGAVASLVRGPVKSEADLIEAIKAWDIWPVIIGRPPRPAASRDNRRPQRRGSERPDRGRGRHRDDRNKRGDGRNRRRGKPPRE
jgi:hypothetical protein